MADFFRRHALLITSILLLGVSMQLMNASLAHPQFAQVGARSVDTVLVPLKKGYHEVSESTKYLWTHYVWLLDVEEQRNGLLERVKELEALNSRLKEYQSENQRLRGLLDFGERMGQAGVTAQVVGRDPSNWVRTITIDRGSDDGLRPGLAVVDGNAIVGQTTVVNSSSAKVLLLTDSTSAIDAIVQSSRAAGVIEGGLRRDTLRLRYIEKLQDTPVQAGDRVIASGLDGVYPKGTLIGVVHRVNANAGGMFQYI
ncbi:MAG: rod shape-determining protein MreC, partial [Bdellovibrionales bacterium]|nr:rod shape-determining protein MreC [Bdellovibrionales bacterium]